MKLREPGYVFISQIVVIIALCWASTRNIPRESTWILGVGVGVYLTCLLGMIALK